MTSRDTKILEFNQYQKSDKVPFTIYADIELEKTDGCKNDPENSSTTKVSEHIWSGFSMSIILSFTSIENKHGVYKCKDCMKNFYEYLTDHVLKITHFKKKKDGVTNKRVAGII